MQAKTVRDLGARVRAARRTHGMTQAELASELRVSRDWVVRLEQGHPRLEAQKVLDALVVLGLALDVVPSDTKPQKTSTGLKKAPARKVAVKKVSAPKVGVKAPTRKVAVKKVSAPKVGVKAPTRKPVKNASTPRNPKATSSNDPFATLFRERS